LQCSGGYCTTAFEKGNVKATDMTTSPSGTTPVPDPTILTTQQLVAAIAAVREILETRLDAMDTATNLNKEQMDKIPSMIDDKIRQLRVLVEEKIAGLMEKFHSIDVQFKERDTRTEQSSKDSKVAVDAALQAAKEAVGEQNKSSALAIAKSEASTNKALDQIGTLITTTNKALDEKINDLKGRLDRGEGVKAQAVENKGQQNWQTSAVIAGVSLLISLGVLIVLVLHK
jgi:hypothetical protein